MNFNSVDIILLVHLMEDPLCKESNGVIRNDNTGLIQMYEKVVVLMDIRFIIKLWF